jgi:hypothetical protein
MGLSNRIEKMEVLPLRSAYTFMKEKNLEKEAEEIRISKEHYKSYTSTLRRGKIVALFEEKHLLDEFIENYWPDGRTDKGKTLLKRYKRILVASQSTTREGEDDEEEEEEDGEESSAFAAEDDLRDYLANNIEKVEPGLTLFTDEDGKEGVEYSIDENSRRIDLLAVDKEGVFVVIELKVKHGHDRVIGQALYYKNMVKRKFNVENVRIIIIGKEITPQLKIAAEDLPGVELFEYKMFFSIERAG